MHALMKGMGAEYSDEVTKSNKKEDMMLDKKLRSGLLLPLPSRFIFTYDSLSEFQTARATSGELSSRI